MKVVVDTNVIVSALINTNGLPAKILSLVLNEKVKVLYDNRIIFEYSEVLSRGEHVFYYSFPNGTKIGTLEKSKQKSDAKDKIEKTIVRTT